jgi:hypothetical protein
MEQIVNSSSRQGFDNFSGFETPRREDGINNQGSGPRLIRSRLPNGPTVLTGNRLRLKEANVLAWKNWSRRSLKHNQVWLPRRSRSILIRQAAAPVTVVRGFGLTEVRPAGASAGQRSLICKRWLLAMIPMRPPAISILRHRKHRGRRHCAFCASCVPVRLGF